MRIADFVVVACVVWSIGAAPVQDRGALSPFPPDGFAFAGTWDCTGAMGTRTHRSTFTGSVTLAKTWLELTEQDLEPATGYVATYLIGYDSERHQLVEFDANNFGASTYTSTDGWHDRVLTMTSAVSPAGSAAYVANRFRYSVTGTDSFTMDWEISRTAALQWVPADHLACQRRHP